MRSCFRDGIELGIDISLPIAIDRACPLTDHGFDDHAPVQALSWFNHIPDHVAELYEWLVVFIELLIVFGGLALKVDVIRLCILDPN